MIVALSASDLPFGGVPGCRRCSCATGYLARYIHANGATALRWVCDWCEDFGTRGDLPRRILEPFGVEIAELPVRRDNRAEYGPPSYPPCVVCGGPATDGHHWAPRCIFPDWPWELRADLCRHHHDEWHARMREHGLRWPHELGVVA